MKYIPFNYFQLVIVPVCFLEYLIGGYPNLNIIAWITPVLWLVFFHFTKPFYAMLTGLVCLTLIYSTQHQVNILDGVSFHLTNLFFSLTYLLPFLINRLLYNQIPVTFKWLLLPLCGVTVEYLMSLSSNGTWGSVGYSQTNIYLLQVLSVTGIYGIVFIIYLNAALLFEIIISAFHKRARFRFAGFASSLLVLAFGFGFVRLQMDNPVKQKVKVMGLTFQGKEAWPWFQEMVWQGNVSIQQRKKEISLKSIRTNLFYLRETKEAIRVYHPKWVIWNEASLLVLQTDYLNFVQVNSRFAKENAVFLGLPYYLASDGFPRQKAENHFIIFNPDGKIIYDYQKNKPVDQMEPALASTVKPRVFATGGIMYSGAICADFDYPQLIRHMRQADLVFAPSADWPGIKDLHATMANARAIENGFALFRITGNGKSSVSDSRGQILESQYHLKRATQLLISDVPIGKRKTVYAVVSDLFSWLCIAGVAIIFVYAIITHANKRYGKN
ncbi:Apolipoprotein N-acyltransferase [Pedobacter westerhofensis]|uniref:Apolipoprotein N-acyltransferase n=1 Tax=Pedobacter westerhofensis TaxID=425512 RepID=A0A521FSC6_9SPHI|nr:nitrilase-related carbon-nitrogen hydrolase [Pedobacter westerhofensis]SMO99123.1 Apolipoprotein N-acyltransferase [Pedobacter westerhofensis]